MTDGNPIDDLAAALVGELCAAGKSVATAESCTGGWIAKALTDIAGSSACFAYGIVSYSNAAKESLLGVSADTLRVHGAVSEAVVREMAAGVLQRSGADFGVAVSGIAGPGGGGADKPVGTVWFAWASRTASVEAVEATLHRLTGDRAAIRSQSVVLALEGLRDRLRGG
ncbi:MAG: CinA family protein [Woeseiaceae bacterium]